MRDRRSRLYDMAPINQITAEPFFVRCTVRRRSAFSLIEAVAAIAITAIAGSALLLGVASSVQNTDEAMRRTIAQGMAEQLIDEALGCRYVALGGNPLATTLGPGPSGPRIAFDEISDYNGYRSQPPTDPYGIVLGQENGLGGQRNSWFQCGGDYLANWRQEVDVYYVGENNWMTRLSAGQTSDFRVVEARIVYVDPTSGPKILAQIRRVVAYVSPLSIN
jgi:type II secretory pathway pseudopilin PulG